MSTHTSFSINAEVSDERQNIPSLHCETKNRYNNSKQYNILPLHVVEEDNISRPSQEHFSIAALLLDHSHLLISIENCEEQSEKLERKELNCSNAINDCGVYIIDLFYNMQSDCLLTNTVCVNTNLLATAKKSVNKTEQESNVKQEVKVSMSNEKEWIDLFETPFYISGIVRDYTKENISRIDLEMEKTENEKCKWKNQIEETKSHDERNNNNNDNVNNNVIEQYEPLREQEKNETLLRFTTEECLKSNLQQEETAKSHSSLSCLHERCKNDYNLDNSHEDDVTHTLLCSPTSKCEVSLSISNTYHAYHQTNKNEICEESGAIQELVEHHSVEPTLFTSELSSTSTSAFEEDQETYRMEEKQEHEEKTKEITKFNAINGENKKEENTESKQVNCLPQRFIVSNRLSNAIWAISVDSNLSSFRVLSSEEFFAKHDKEFNEVSTREIDSKNKMQKKNHVSNDLSNEIAGNSNTRNYHINNNSADDVISTSECNNCIFTNDSEYDRRNYIFSNVMQRTRTKFTDSNVSPIIGCVDGVAGFVDGHFTIARFNKPCSLCWRLPAKYECSCKDVNVNSLNVNSSRLACNEVLLNKTIHEQDTHNIGNQHKTVLCQHCEVLFISDRGNHAIRYANFRNRLVRTIVGVSSTSPIAGYRDGSCLSSRLSYAINLIWVQVITENNANASSSSLLERRPVTHTITEQRNDTATTTTAIVGTAIEFGNSTSEVEFDTEQTHNMSHGALVFIDKDNEALRIISPLALDTPNVTTSVTVKNEEKSVVTNKNLSTTIRTEDEYDTMSYVTNKEPMIMTLWEEQWQEKELLNNAPSDTCKTSNFNNATNHAAERVSLRTLSSAALLTCTEEQYFTHSSEKEDCHETNPCFMLVGEKYDNEKCVLQPCYCILTHKRLKEKTCCNSKANINNNDNNNNKAEVEYEYKASDNNKWQPQSQAITLTEIDMLNRDYNDNNADDNNSSNKCCKTILPEVLLPCSFIAKSNSSICDAIIAIDVHRNVYLLYNNECNNKDTHLLCKYVFDEVILSTREENIMNWNKLQHETCLSSNVCDIQTNSSNNNTHNLCFALLERGMSALISANHYRHRREWSLRVEHPHLLPPTPSTYYISNNTLPTIHRHRRSNKHKSTNVTRPCDEEIVNEQHTPYEKKNVYLVSKHNVNSNNTLVVRSNASSGICSKFDNSQYNITEKGSNNNNNNYNNNNVDSVYVNINNSDENMSEVRFNTKSQILFYDYNKKPLERMEHHKLNKSFIGVKCNTNVVDHFVNQNINSADVVNEKCIEVYNYEKKGNERDTDNTSSTLSKQTPSRPVTLLAPPVKTPTPERVKLTSTRNVAEKPNKTQNNYSARMTKNMSVTCSNKKQDSTNKKLFSFNNKHTSIFVNTTQNSVSNNNDNNSNDRDNVDHTYSQNNLNAAHVHSYELQQEKISECMLPVQRQRAQNLSNVQQCSDVDDRNIDKSSPHKRLTSRAMSVHEMIRKRSSKSHNSALRAQSVHVTTNTVSNKGNKAIKINVKPSLNKASVPTLAIPSDECTEATAHDVEQTHRIAEIFQDETCTSISENVKMQSSITNLHKELASECSEQERQISNEEHQDKAICLSHEEQREQEESESEYEYQQKQNQEVIPESHYNNANHKFWSSVDHQQASEIKSNLEYEKKSLQQSEKYEKAEQLLHSELYEELTHQASNYVTSDVSNSNQNTYRNKIVANEEKFNKEHNTHDHSYLLRTEWYNSSIALLFNIYQTFAKRKREVKLVLPYRSSNTEEQYHQEKQEYSKKKEEQEFRDRSKSINAKTLKELGVCNNHTSKNKNSNNNNNRITLSVQNNNDGKRVHLNSNSLIQRQEKKGGIKKENELLQEENQPSTTCNISIWRESIKILSKQSVERDGQGNVMETAVEPEIEEVVTYEMNIVSLWRLMVSSNYLCSILALIKQQEQQQQELWEENTIINRKMSKYTNIKKDSTNAIESVMRHNSFALTTEGVLLCLSPEDVRVMCEWLYLCGLRRHGYHTLARMDFTNFRRLILLLGVWNAKAEFNLTEHEEPDISSSSSSCHTDFKNHKNFPYSSINSSNNNSSSNNGSTIVHYNNNNNNNNNDNVVNNHTKRALSCYNQINHSTHFAFIDSLSALDSISDLSCVHLYRRAVKHFTEAIHNSVYGNDNNTNNINTNNINNTRHVIDDKSDTKLRKGELNEVMEALSLNEQTLCELFECYSTEVHIQRSHHYTAPVSVCAHLSASMSAETCDNNNNNNNNKNNCNNSKKNIKMEMCRLWEKMENVPYARPTNTLPFPKLPTPSHASRNNMSIQTTPELPHSGKSFSHKESLELQSSYTFRATPLQHKHTSHENKENILDKLETNSSEYVHYADTSVDKYNPCDLLWKLKHLYSTSVNENRHVMENRTWGIHVMTFTSFMQLWKVFDVCPTLISFRALEEIYILSLLEPLILSDNNNNNNDNDNDNRNTIFNKKNVCKDSSANHCCKLSMIKEIHKICESTALTSLMFVESFVRVAIESFSTYGAADASAFPSVVSKVFGLMIWMNKQVALGYVAERLTRYDKLKSNHTYSMFTTNFTEKIRRSRINALHNTHNSGLINSTFKTNKSIMPSPHSCSNLTTTETYANKSSNNNNYSNNRQSKKINNYKSSGSSNNKKNNKNNTCKDIYSNDKFHVSHANLEHSL